MKEPIITVHISEDIKPETLQALGEMMLLLRRQVMFEDLRVGTEVHYMQASGPHLEAKVTRVGQDGVVDLAVKDDSGEYVRKAVVYREEPTAYSWHFISDQCSKGEQDANHSL